MSEEATETQPKVPWWVLYIKEFGLPSVVACAILYGGWQIVIWTGDNVVKPWMEDARESNKEFRSIFQTQSKAMENIAIEVKSNGESIRNIESDIQAIKTTVGK